MKQPISWTSATIGELSESINPGFPSGKHNQESIGIPHLRPMNISRNGEINLSLVKYVQVENYSPLLANDVLFDNTNSPELVGKTTYIKQDSNWAFSNHMTRIRPRLEIVAASWMAHALHYLYVSGYFKLNCRHHVNQASISSSYLAGNVEIPVPPLAEQERIIARIESLFTQLDAGVAGLKGLQAALKRYKGSVLKAACEGRFVPQDPSDGRGEASAHKPLGGVRPHTADASPQQLPKGWEWRRIDEIAEHRLGKMLDKEKNKGEMRPYIRNINVRWFGFNLDDIQTMRILDRELENVSVQRGDLVVCEGGEPGRAAVWNKEEPMVIQKALHRVRPNEGVLSIYIAYCLATDAFTGRLEKYFTGSTIKHFTGQSLKAYSIPLPPLEEQRRIVAEVERRLSVVQELEQVISASLKRASRLRQAILKRAFEGRLV